MANRATIFALQGELPPLTAEEEHAILNAARRYRDAYAGYLRAEQYDVGSAEAHGHPVNIAGAASDELGAFEDWLLRTAVGVGLPASEYWHDGDDDFGEMFHLPKFLGGRDPDPFADYAVFHDDEEG